MWQQDPDQGQCVSALFCHLAQQTCHAQPRSHRWFSATMRLLTHTHRVNLHADLQSRCMFTTAAISRTPCNTWVVFGRSHECLFNFRNLRRGLERLSQRRLISLLVIYHITFWPHCGPLCWNIFPYTVSWEAATVLLAPHLPPSPSAPFMTVIQRFLLIAPLHIGSRTFPSISEKKAWRGKRW